MRNNCYEKIQSPRTLKLTRVLKGNKFKTI